MPVAKTKLTKQHASHKKWYLALILVALVAIAGIVYVRFSNASSVVSRDAYKVIPGLDGNCIKTQTLASSYGSGYSFWTAFCPVGAYKSGLTRWVVKGTWGPCYFITPSGSKGSSVSPGYVGNAIMNKTTSCDV